MRSTNPNPGGHCMRRRVLSPSFGPNGSPSRELAYRGYLIRRTLDGATFVSKDRFLICWANDIRHAIALIDALAC